LCDVARGARNAGALNTEELDQQRALVILPKRKDVYRIVGEVFEQRELLPTEERSRFDDQILAVSERLKSAGRYGVLGTSFLLRYRLASLTLCQRKPGVNGIATGKGREL